METQNQFQISLNFYVIEIVTYEGYNCCVFRTAVYFVVYFAVYFTVYFDQLSGAARTRKLVKILFSAVFNLFCSYLLYKNHR